jgi:thiosulfate reductase cytochrome b subunit
MIHAQLCKECRRGGNLPLTVPGIAMGLRLRLQSCQTRTPGPGNRRTGAHPIVSAASTYDIFNKNSWGRSLHFLAAWFLVVTGLVYLLAGLATGHLWRNFVPRLRELAPQRLWQDVVAHVHLPLAKSRGGPPYGVLQKVSYAGVVLIALPLMTVTGLAMSPAIPGLLDSFGGSQSARTIHFFVFAVLVLYLTIWQPPAGT